MKKLLGITIVVLLVFSCLGGVVSATEQPQEIKVGYVSNYGTVKAAFSQGSEGYGYEYMTNLLGYMDGAYTLTFVDCTSFQDCLNKLDSGEIDIIGPTMQYEGLDYIYSANDFGSCTIMLATLDTDIENVSFEGATIAVPDYYMDYTCLTEFLETEGFDAEIVKIPSSNLNITIGMQNIDFVYMTSIQSHSGLTVVTGLDSQPLYLMATADNQDLMDEIDRAREALEVAEPYFQSQLTLEYGSYNFANNAYIADTSLALVQEKDTYRVGIRNFYSPLIREDEDGELEGVAFVLLDMLSEEAGVDFEYVLIENDATQADYDSVDFMISATNSTAEFGFPTVSSPYLDLPFVLLEHQDSVSEEGENQRIGVASYYRTDSLMVDDTLYGREVVKYTTVQELQQAFDAGDIDCMLITVVSLNMIRDDFETQEYIATVVDDTLQLCLAFSENMTTTEMTVFNKLISIMDQATLEAATLEYAITNQEITFGELLASNPWIAINGVGVLFLAVFVTVVFFFVKQRKAVTAMMNVDDVTGIMTEHKFIEEARRILQENPTRDYRLATFDVDSFKYVNEIYGYETGTVLLKLIGEQMSKRIDEEIIVARGAADRFMTLAPMIDSETAIQLVQEDMENVHAALQEVIGKAYKLYFSIGVYEIHNRDYDITIMLDYANSARQQGKLRAGNSVSVFTPQMQQEINNNNHFTSIMEEALKNEEFVLHFQPKVLLSTEEMAGAEVLIRWQRADECLPPYHFIPLFEKNGFIEEMDYYVLTKTCVFLQNYQSIVKGRISVNLSGVTILQEKVVENIVAIVAKYEISPAQLDLEITETAFVDTSDVLEKIQQLRSHGFTISMDDFGAGVSSLNRLKNIHVDTLKIDREFIIDAIENPRGNKILQRVIEMANDLQLETVAEGIETIEQGTLLKNLGCQIGQGYYYARPMSKQQFITYCQDQHPS
ncbi:EAL domain-containing protein [Bengtsoniella intestinalis]|uniref:EAL domain-containing protein n=1 Tax=Bengtsoniella intestinalis TaxID=3073143 RepID=UPI00391FB670